LFLFTGSNGRLTCYAFLLRGANAISSPCVFVGVLATRLEKTLCPSLPPREGCQHPYDRNAVAGMSETHPLHLVSETLLHATHYEDMVETRSMSQIHVRIGWAYGWDSAKIYPKRISVPKPMSEMVWHTDGTPQRYVRKVFTRPEPMSEMVGIRTGHYKDMPETYFSVPDLCPKRLTYEWGTAKICPKRISAPRPMSDMVWHTDGTPQRHVRNLFPRPEPMSEMVGIQTGYYKDMQRWLPA
jgi:hypothetical protein